MSGTVASTIVAYPDPYHPSYDTIGSLVDDSTYIVMAKFGSSDAGGASLEVEEAFGFNNPRTSIGVTAAEARAARLTPGGTYIFFYGVDLADKSVCIVGGVRGVLAYDPATMTVTRIDPSTSSRIPRMETLAQFRMAVDTEDGIEDTKPVANGPPVCAASATGL